MWSLLSAAIFFAVACLLGALLKIEPLWQISAIAFSIALSVLVITNPLRIVRWPFQATAWFYRAERLLPLTPASNRMVFWSLFGIEALFAFVYLLGMLLDYGLLRFSSMVGFLVGFIFVLIIPLPPILRWFVRSVCWCGKSFRRSLLLVWTFYRWLNFRRAVLLLFGLCFLIFLCYAEEDFRGWLTWQHFKHEWEAKGERFDYASIVPPPVPDDQNFALTPIVASCYEWGLTRDGKRITPFKTNVVDRLRMSIDHVFPQTVSLIYPTNGNWALGESCDLKSWQMYYRTAVTNEILVVENTPQGETHYWRPSAIGGSILTNDFAFPPTPQSPAADVLLALSKYDSDIEELRKASSLPYSRFPLNYEDMLHHSTNTPVVLLMHLASIKRCIQVLNLRAVAELENNQSGKAFDDVRLALRLVDATRVEPNASSQFQRTEDLNIVFQAIWEGLAKHKWTDAHLAAIEQELGKLDFLTDSQLTMRGERNEVFDASDYYRRLRPYHEFRQMFAPVVMMSPGPDDLRRMEREETYEAMIMCLIPSGWFYQDKLVIGKTYQQWSLQTTDPGKHLAFPAVAQNGQKFINSLPHRPWNTFASRFSVGVGTANLRLIYAQEMTDLARIACALERYRLAQGQYPDSLAALVPQFIKKVPHDIIGGQPLRYHRTADGKYLLYSVGWNETDDGGKIGMAEGSNYLRITMGDWVWPCP